MDGRNSSKEKLERHRNSGTRVWVWYLIAVALLAVTRVALLLWLNHRLATHTSTEMDHFLQRLYPEGFMSIFWNSLAGFEGTKYYLAWGAIVTLGSFVMATPILLVGWLHGRRR